MLAFDFKIKPYKTLHPISKINQRIIRKCQVGAKLPSDGFIFKQNIKI